MAWQISADVVGTVGEALSTRYPVVYVRSWEEERLERILEVCCETDPQLQVWTWSSSAGFNGGPGPDESFRDPHKALAFIKDNCQPAVIVMRDLPAYLLANPSNCRLVRDIYDQHTITGGMLIMVHPGLVLPEDLNKEVYSFRLPLPDAVEIASYLDMLNQSLPSGRHVSSEWQEECALEMKGLTINEAGIMFRRLLATENAELDEARVLIRKQRAQVLMEENCLDLVDSGLGLESIGGLKNLKRWIESRYQLFGNEAQEAGIEPPSGILMMGVSGCGKSLAAKVIAAAWKIPLVRLDMNLIMSGAWGTPEQAWSRALASIESVAPVAVWLDEIENSFGYINGQSTAGNLTIFSSFLTWMQEKAKGVFVVATANNIDLLPAEMLRKGRFDELFFLDLPKPEARAEILAIHIEGQGQDPKSFDLVQLSELLEGWTAAEIEQMVKSTRLEAFYKKRNFTFEDLRNTCFKMVPLSKTMSEQINELRRWARSRAVSAD